MKEEWLLRGAVVPVDVETTAALVAEIHRLIDAIGGMALAQAQEPVAFFDPQSEGFYWAKPTKVIPPITVNVEPLPLYTSPPAQRIKKG